MVNRWENIRSNWVNGNQSYRIQSLDKMSKRAVIELAYEALETFHGLGNQSGDLIDLLEILRRYVRGKNYGLF